MIDEAERLISGGISHLYISLVDLDHISHVYGPESNEHIERIEFLSMSIKIVYDAKRMRNLSKLI